MLVTRTAVNVSSPNDISTQAEKGGGGTTPNYAQPRRQKGVGSGKGTGYRLLRLIQHFILFFFQTLMFRSKTIIIRRTTKSEIQGIMIF